MSRKIVAWVSVGDIIGDDTIHLGMAELDDPLAQIAQVLQKVVIIGVDKFPRVTAGLAILELNSRTGELKGGG